MKTIILTGVWNTGKDHAAAMLHKLGIKMDYGNQAQPTLDDYELAYLFSMHPQTIPVDLIRNRDLVEVDWGTKMGEFWNCCSHATVDQLFTNPRVIIMQRDLAIIRQESGRCEDEIAEEISRSVYWAKRLSCPVLHLSAEMMFRYPDRAQNVMASFCGVKVPQSA